MKRFIFLSYYVWMQRGIKSKSYYSIHQSCVFLKLWNEFILYNQTNVLHGSKCDTFSHPQLCHIWTPLVSNPIAVNLENRYSVSNPIAVNLENRYSVSNPTNWVSPLSYKAKAMVLAYWWLVHFLCHNMVQSKMKIQNCIIVWNRRSAIKQIPTFNIHFTILSNIKESQ